MPEAPLVLIVEDDPSTNNLIAGVLRRAGYRSVQAFTNEEGLQRFSESTFSLITTDRGHPGGESGIAFVTQVRSMPNGRLVPILMISGSLTGENELAAWRAGVSGVMHKPFEAADLIAEVGKLLSKASEKDQTAHGLGIEAPLEQPKENSAPAKLLTEAGKLSSETSEKDKTPPEADIEATSIPKEKSGVRGWLLLLCILLTVVKGFGFLVTLVQAIGHSETSLLYGFYALYFALGTLAGVLLWAKARIAVTFAKSYYVIQPYAVSLFWIRMMTIDPSTTSQGPSVIIQAAVFSVVWFSYLTFSRRVRNTYNVDPAKRNTFLALIMGAAFGPLGTIYFHIRVFLMTVLGTLVATVLGVLAARIFGFPLPPWMGWVWLCFFPIANAILAINWNDSSTYPGAEGIDWPSASAFGVVLGIWVFRVIGISTAIYGAVRLFGQHHVFLGIVLLLLLPWAMSLPAKWIMTVIAAVVGLIVSARQSNKA